MAGEIRTPVGTPTTWFTDNDGNPVQVSPANPLPSTASANFGDITIGTVAQGTAAAAAGSWPVEVTDGTNVLGTPAHPLRTDPTGATAQPVTEAHLANLDITLSALRDALRGVSTKTLTDVVAAINAIGVSIGATVDVTDRSGRLVGVVTAANLDIALSSLRDSLVGSPAKTLKDVVTALGAIAGTVTVSNLPATQAVSVTDGSDATFGAEADASAGTDTGSATYMALFKRLLSRFTIFLGRLPAVLGQNLMAGSLSVTVASDQSAVPVSGSLTTTPSGTQDSNLTKVAGTTVDVNSGNKSAGTLRVVLATDQPQLTATLKVDGSGVTQPVSGTVTANAGSGNFAATVADGADATFGAKADAAAVGDTSTATYVSLFKRLLQRVTTLLGQLPTALGQTTAAGSLSVVLASDQFGNVERALLASGAHTTTQQSADQASASARGLSVIVNVSVVPGSAPALTPTLLVKDPISGNYFAAWAATAPLTAVGTYAYLFYPGGVAVEGSAWTEILPFGPLKTWALEVVAGNANSATYSVAGVVLQ